MITTIQSILVLSKNRIASLRENNQDGWYQWSWSHFDGIFDELEEARKEIEDEKYIYLEDELGDVFWDYMCLLEWLEQEWKIFKSRVFERCLRKFSTRINPDGTYNWNWNEVKKLQKNNWDKNKKNNF